MKVCVRCSVELLRDTKSSHKSYCKDCLSEYKKTHYKANKLSYIKSRDKKRERIKNIIKGNKSKPCLDCKETFHFSVMQFDHITNNKNFQISKAGSNLVNFKRVLEEINKCEVVCANCHRLRTFNRVGDGRETEIKNYVRKIKEDGYCLDCKKQLRFFQMDFDHRPEENKRKNISIMVKNKTTLPAIKDEIKKCDLVCANCHHLRTFKRTKRKSLARQDGIEPT